LNGLLTRRIGLRESGRKKRFVNIVTLIDDQCCLSRKFNDYTKTGKIKYTMSSTFNLERFVKAQENTYLRALAEMKAGEKTSHWMWYVFPQIAGLGRSSNAKFYAIKSSLEAAEYLHHPILGKRLIEITSIVLQINRKTAYQVFHNPDYLKFRSCMTLFASIPNANPVFQQALDKYFDGKKDEMTVDILQTE